MRRAVLIVGITWIALTTVAALLGFLPPLAFTIAAAAIAGVLWMPVALVRWARRELRPQDHWLWIGINAAVIVFGGLTFGLLIVSLYVINLSIWLVFFVALKVSGWQSRRPTAGSPAPNGS